MKQITSGQKEQCVTVIKDAARKGGEEVVNELVGNGVLNGDNIQRILGQGDKIAPKVREFVKKLFAELAENIRGFVKLVSGSETIELEATDGKQTIAGVPEVFTWGIDGDFKSWGCNVESAPTDKMKVHVHELIKNGTFAQIFGGLSDNLDQLCLTQSQIIQFVQKHKKWLKVDGYGAFFLFKVGEEFFVARVSLRSASEPGASVYRFSDDRVWLAVDRDRIVVPQLPL